ncbi:non-ribosomal peptide synthetase [Pseudonocardia humida]|uniref:Amino acid adenylation domain-containing protein n=1 Tax=Pseudonocardia humida TaxID=2800819 RepID=A0ABT1A3Y6_9PSEU|nr:non-ribosomal peptide synthetase [Pseudonocardia humida]MCO1657715.1 amino acid adenylation domain-containing protein [Pseudonocardia humida]
MEKTTVDREFWRDVLRAGGATALPRWTSTPTAGAAAHEAAVPADVVAGLHRLADELDVPVGALLVAAHAKVLTALAGETEVVTGYPAAAGGPALPCGLTTAPGTWRELVREVAGVVARLRVHAGVDVDELRRELGVPGPSFETVVDPTGTDTALTGGVVLVLGAAPGLDRLRVRYRTDVLDADAAARIAGYHVRALELIAADPAAEHRRQSLLSAAELRFQLEGLAGPRRELPDLRAHELFEQRVAEHPEAVAAVQGDRSWTYRELNARANRLARALLARGLRREGVVAVVTERNLDWMAAVLAVFKAGGVYLPIEPHFPADRIATTLSRADCGLVLTEPGSTTGLDEALGGLPDVRRVLIDDACAEDRGDGDLGVPVAADQLAYIYFTSGSTGQPKGAMCEHAGMLNHLFAKIDDLGIREARVVAQVAPQCFDISLWQLVAAVLVGGRTVIVEQDVVLDVDRFVDTIAAQRVAVLQVVPSYLEVVLTHLGRYGRALPDLRCVSATGEALKVELVQRFFAALPGLALVNAYGLTETSDDTNHEVMTEPPADDRVPLGPAVGNVRVYVVDENLSPVPLGAPGLISFSGVCVGRGYVNDPERTAAAYMDDPHRPGERLYLGGDYGRWRPDGKLEFLGRRDSQVKISGFRIELGEIDNALLGVPGVRDGAVVVAERPDRSKHLVAFYAGPTALDPELIRARLGASLPHYMVPALLHWRERLPLTGNGKIDTKALTALAAELGAGDGAGADGPATPTEERLAVAWSGVLGVPQDHIGRRDDFFDRGGSSISAVRLVVAMNREVSLKDVTGHPVLADLAALVDTRARQRSEPVAGPGGGLLQQLSDPAGSRAPALVCFPYAGGNAVNFRPMAKALEGSGTPVYAVELPGHDLVAEREPFAPLPRIVEQVVDEIIARRLWRVRLWGHSSGAAMAVAAARLLEERGVTVERVFLAAQLAGTATARRAAAAATAARATAAIAAELSSDSGYSELGELDAQRAGHVAAAYRHDCASAHEYLADALEAGSPRRVAAPVTVVVAADDPSTAGYPDRHREWEFLGDDIAVHELPDGGHYFLRTRPDQAAAAVLHASELLTTS